MIVLESVLLLRPSSSIVLSTSIPSGATSHPGSLNAASGGSGSCHPFSTLSLSISINFASCVCADL